MGVFILLETKYEQHSIDNQFVDEIVYIYGWIFQQHWLVQSILEIVNTTFLAVIPPPLPSLSLHLIHINVDLRYWADPHLNTNHTVLGPTNVLVYSFSSIDFLYLARSHERHFYNFDDQSEFKHDWFAYNYSFDDLHDVVSDHRYHSFVISTCMCIQRLIHFTSLLQCNPKFEFRHVDHVVQLIQS